MHTARKAARQIRQTEQGGARRTRPVTQQELNGNGARGLRLSDSRFVDGFLAEVVGPSEGLPHADGGRLCRGTSSARRWSGRCPARPALPRLGLPRGCACALLHSRLPRACPRRHGSGSCLRLRHARGPCCSVGLSLGRLLVASRQRCVLAVSRHLCLRWPVAQPLPWCGCARHLARQRACHALPSLP